LNRATVEGLLVRLPRGITLLAGKENVSAATPGAFYSELIGGRTGYVRLGTLNNANLQALDKALSGFAAKKVTDLIVDLRASSATNDLSMATEFAKRFCPKGKPIFTVRKPTGHQDRVFSSDRDPAFRGLVMVLADSDTSGAAEAIAAALRFYNKALVIGQPTAGRAPNIQTCHCPMARICGSPWLKWCRPKVDHCFATALNQICPSKCHCQRSDRFFSRTAKREWDRSFTRRGVRT
jgi:Periplasmic protease